LLFGIGVLWSALSAHHRLETARGTLRTKDEEAIIGYVRSHVQPGEKILIYPYGPIFYYLTDTFSPSHFDFLQPGMHSPEQFQDTIRELSSQQTRVVLLQTSFSEAYSLVWPNTPIEIIAAKDPVQEYIFSHYHSCSQLSANGFWRI